jgi:hypothetical protein
MDERRKYPFNGRSKLGEGRITLTTTLKLWTLPKQMSEIWVRDTKSSPKFLSVMADRVKTTMKPSVNA